MVIKTEQVALRLRQDIKDALRKAADADRRSMSAVIEGVLEAWLRRGGWLKGRAPPAWAVRHPMSMRRAFNGHKASAKQRGIQFLFDFDAWVAWWMEDDRWDRRDRERLCMARKEDAGAYSPENVYCTTRAKNSQDYWDGRRRKTIADD